MPAWDNLRFGLSPIDSDIFAGGNPRRPIKTREMNSPDHLVPDRGRIFRAPEPYRSRLVSIAIQYCSWERLASTRAGPWNTHQYFEGPCEPRRRIPASGLPAAR